MIFHGNCLLADDSHEISYFIFFKLETMSQNLSSATVVNRALRVNVYKLSKSIRVCNYNASLKLKKT